MLDTTMMTITAPQREFDPIILFNPDIDLIKNISKVSNNKIIWIICTGEIDNVMDYNNIPKSNYISTPLYCRSMEEVSAYIKLIKQSYEI